MGAGMALRLGGWVCVGWGWGWGAPESADGAGVGAAAGAALGAAGLAAGAGAELKLDCTFGAGGALIGAASSHLTSLDRERDTGTDMQTSILAGGHLSEARSRKSL